MLEPRSRGVDPNVLMESLFKLTELENRFPLNLNVLMGGLVPRVVGLAECLREWLDHRRDVLLRRSRHRLAEIKHRLEVLGGYLIAYLNIDLVIKIIRREDEPKPVLMKRFKLYRRAGDRDPRHAAAQFAQARGIRDQARAQGTEGRKIGTREAGRLAGAAVEIDQRRHQESARDLWADDRARPPPHRLRAGEGNRSQGRDGSDDREGADHRRRLGKGLGPRAEGPQRGRQEPHLQGRRQIRLLLLRADDLEASCLRHQWPLLHDRGLEASGRARVRRAGEPDGGHGGRRDREHRALRRRAEIPRRLEGRQRIRGQGRRLPRQYPQGQADIEREGAGSGGARSRSSKAIPSRSSATTASW